MLTGEQIELNDRHKKILRTIISDYITNIKPVGSRTIAKKFNYEISPATIRNIMSDLEEMGYITHPHTSAGRIPTDKGYRFYVNSLMEVRDISLLEKQRIETEYTARIKEVDGILSVTSRVLSAISNLTGVVSSPVLDKTVIKYVNIHYIEKGRALFLIVTQSGLIETSIIDIPQHLTRFACEKVSNWLNERVADLPYDQGIRRINETRASVNQQIKHSRSLTDVITKLVDLLGLFGGREDLYLEGTKNIIRQPEFRDSDTLERLFAILEQKDLLKKAINMNKTGMEVVIGAENHLDAMKKCSIITSTYVLNDKPIGYIGIIGPTRMEYPRILSLISFVSKIVNKMLEEEEL